MEKYVELQSLGDGKTKYIFRTDLDSEEKVAQAGRDTEQWNSQVLNNLYKRSCENVVYSPQTGLPKLPSDLFIDRLKEADRRHGGYQNIPDAELTHIGDLPEDKPDMAVFSGMAADKNLYSGADGFFMNKKIMPYKAALAAGYVPREEAERRFDNDVEEQMTDMDGIDSTR